MNDRLSLLLAVQYHYKVIFQATRNHFVSKLNYNRDTLQQKPCSSQSPTTEPNQQGTREMEDEVRASVGDHDVISDDVQFH